MPSATPVPRGPSRLALFGAEDLLCATGCPVCRYEAEARDRFLGWFALEAHAEAGTITRLCRSLGFCPAHTRELLGQPGAEGRMTAVYRYVLQAAAGHLAAGTRPAAPCPACEHDAEAARRALDTLLTGLREDGLRDRYRDADGLCLPHLRAAARSAGRRLTAWLAGEMAARLDGAGGPRTLALIAGDPDPDADVRVRLRAALPPDLPRHGGDVCPPCLAGALAERAALASPQAGLCPAHLHEACADAGGRGHGPLSAAAAQVLTLNSERPASWLAESAEPVGLAGAARALADRRRHPRHGAGAERCPACCAASTAAARWLEAWSAATARPPTVPVPRLCLRHVMSPRPRDSRAAEAGVRAAAAETAMVLEELEEALRKRTWTNRNEPRGREMSAWRRAAALVDGRVYGGGPPGALGWRPAAERPGVK
jgi:hypothetical protein